MGDNKGYTFNLPGGNKVTVKMPSWFTKSEEPTEQVRDITESVDTKPGAVDDNATKRVRQRNENLMKGLDAALDTTTDAERRVFPKSYREDED